MNDKEKTKQQLIDELSQLRELVNRQETQLAQAAQAESDQQQIRSSLPVLVATAGVDGYYKEVNDAFERILGWSERESLSRPFIEFIHPDDRAKAIQTFEQLRSGASVIDFVDRNLCKDGSHRWINWVVIPVPHRNVVFGIGQDITFRVRAEREIHEYHELLEQRVEERTAALQKSNEQLTIFRTFAEAAGQGFGMADMDGKIAYANAALARLVGEDEPEDALGKPPSTYYTDDYGKQHEEEIFPVLERDEAWQGELTMISLTGEHIPVLQTSFTLTDQGGVPVRRGVVVTDLRKVKQAEEELRRSESKYKALVESSPDAVLMVDLETQITFASPQAAERHGVDTPSQLIGRSVMSLVVERERPLMQQNIQRLLESGIRRNDQYTGLREDGTTFFGEVSASVIPGASGEPEALMAVYRDITERKQAQDAVRKEREFLHRMLQASDHDRELITFEIHDGVSQPLLAALMQFEACLEASREGTQERARAMFDAGLKALRGASSESRSLMNRTRTPVLQRFGVAAAIADFIDQFSDKANAPEITYHCDVRFKRLQPVLENAIFRVAQEAITNACKHAQGELVRVAMIQRGEEVTVEIQDEGVGFDVARAAEGRFGLDGIRARTRLLGSGLDIESEPGRGTCIRAKFPLLYEDE